MELRPYQLKAVEDIAEAAAKHRRILFVLPTGGGKTVLASQVVKNVVDGGQKALFICHRREILFQTVDKLKAFGIEAASMISGDPYDPTLQCVVASIPTFHSWVIRRKKEKIPEAYLVITDEADLTSSSKTWQEIHELYPQAILLGLTATPINSRGKGLAEHFDVMVQGPSYSDGIKEGWLVKPKYYVPSIPDLSAVHTVAGDYNKAELEAAMNKPKIIGDIFTNLERIAPNKKTMVFTCGVKHSIEVAERGNALGIPSAHVDGQMESKERDEVVARFRHGDIKLIANCAVFTRGSDFPDLEVLVNARPTKSLNLYLQIIGRALRPAPGKEFATIIDHSGCTYTHGPIDQDWDWKLTVNASDEEKRVKRLAEKKKRSITCKNCNFIFEGTVVCPECGTKVERKGKPVPTFEAYLQALNEEDMIRTNGGLSAREWYQQLLGFTLQRKFSDGWAAHKYKEKFRKWPARDWKGIPAIQPSKFVAAYCWEKINAFRLAKQKQPA